MRPSIAPKTTIGRRWLILIPVASVMYLVAFLDRTNLSLVLPYMGDDLGLSSTDKGLASGIFFIGYVIIQVPAALLAQRWSAKKTVLILMLLWGVTAMATGLVQNTGQLLTARLVLGFFEGGVQPATLILIAKWFPQKEKARASGFWLLCIPFAAIIASPLTGALLDHLSWRTVLIIEGLPPVVWAVVWFLLIAERPSGARWLPAAERASIEAALAEDERTSDKTITGAVRYRDVARDPKVIVLTMAWFFYNAGFYGFTLWLPQVIKDLVGGSSTVDGFVTAVPYVFGMAVMVVISVLTDRQGSRRLTVMLPLAVSAVALVSGQFGAPRIVEFTLLCLVGAGLYVHGAFFALPSLVVRPETLAVALGVIGGLGNLGGFLGPYLVGWTTDLTGSTNAGFVVMGVSLFAAGVCMAKVTPPRERNAFVTASESSAPTDEAAVPATALSKTHGGR